MAEIEQPRADDSPLSRLTWGDYFGVAGTYYETAEKLVQRLAEEFHMPISKIIDKERGDQVISIVALGMGPLDHVELVDPAAVALADSHGMRNIATPVFGYAALLPDGNPVRIAFEKIHNQLQRLFWPI